METAGYVISTGRPITEASGELGLNGKTVQRCARKRLRMSSRFFFSGQNHRTAYNYVYGMYEMYHAESIGNAFADLDSLIQTGETAW